MKVFRIVKAFVGLASNTAPSPDASAMAEALKSNRPAPKDTLVERRKANDTLASELQKTHSRIGPAPKGK